MLIFTKLQRPKVSDDFVARERLIERLTQARHLNLTLVSAPAGYGKSSLVASWLESSGCTSVWYSLDKSDVDLFQFAEYLITGIEAQVPGSCVRSAPLLQAAEPPPLSAIAASLVNDLAEIAGPLLLALDDYHLIDGSEPARLIETLLEYLPSQAHIVLITRQDPDLPLIRYKANRQMLEVRVVDLQFTEDEASIFLAGAMGEGLTTETLHLLSEKTEGWIVGLRLAALSLRGNRQVDEFRKRLSATNGGLVVEYLVSEVLAQTSPTMHKFLLITSICDRFCAQLCDTLMDNSDPLVNAESFILSLARTNTFLISLDGDGEWWRYHHLFQDLLQHQLRIRYSAVETAELHRCASGWFAANGYDHEAIRHAFAAGDPDGAADLIEQYRHRVMNSDNWHRIEIWLGQLPEEVKQHRPALLVAQAWIAFYRHALWAIPALIERAEGLMCGHADEPLRGEIDFFHGLDLFWQGDSIHSLTVLGRALERIPEANHQARGEAELFYGVSGQMSGQSETAIKALNQLLYGEHAAFGVRKMRLLGSLIFIHLLTGDLAEAHRTTMLNRKTATELNSAYIGAWTDYLEGFIHFSRYELAEAAACFERAVEQRYVLHVRAAIDSLIGQAVTCHYLGQEERTQAAMTMLLDFAHDTNQLPYILLAESCRARISILQNADTQSRRWLRTADLTLDIGTMFYWLEVPRITACRVLAAQDSDVDLKKGLEALARYATENQAVHNVRQLIDITALQAVISAKLGNHNEAVHFVQRALELAEPGGWIQPFVELGDIMASLLRSRQWRAATDEFAERIIASFPVPQPSSTSASTSALTPYAKLKMEEFLTDRELEILALLAQRYRNKEIAARLYISPVTVKRHASNIYQKLQVSNRRQAVAKATELGILSTTT